MLLPSSLLLSCLCGLALGASETSPPPGDPPPAREARSGGLSRWAAPDPDWKSVRLASAPSSSLQGTRGLRFVDGGSPLQPLPSDLSPRDYRFEPYYRQQQDIPTYERNRDRDYYESPRYNIDYNRQPSIPRRIIYFDDLPNRNKGPSSFFYPQPAPQQSYNSYDRFAGVRSPSIGVAPYRYVDQGRGNSILSEGTVENAPLGDDPYRGYNPRQPAPWSVQVGTSLTVKDDGRHAGGAGRRYYVQSQREEPPLARSLGLRSHAGERLWSALQPLQPRI